VARKATVAVKVVATTGPPAVAAAVVSIVSAIMRAVPNNNTHTGASN
jgi:hypothetical protein